MSGNGIYAALSGAMAQSQRLDTIANNIANVDTTGFKKDGQVFSDYVTVEQKPIETNTVPRITASVNSFYNTQGTETAYVDSHGTFTDFGQGALKITGNPLDVAIEGHGFFEVQTPSGVKLTRNGAFKINAQGELVTSDGYPVLRAGNSNPSNRIIHLTSGNLTIGYSGDIFENDNPLGKLAVVNVKDTDALQKVGNSLYTLKPNYKETPHQANNFKIHQGYLEMSNVNIVNEMTKMIEATRTFQANRNAMHTFDQMEGELDNDVPKVVSP